MVFRNSLLLFLLFMVALIQTSGNLEPISPRKILPNRVRHRRSRGKYTMKEEIVRRVEAIHPCGLSKTAVKVTFPGMKSEVLVSFLGYKEPNLMHVNRCKGRCGNNSGRVACVPVKRKMRKVKMHLWTQVLGSQKKKEKFRELMLEEHEECECKCLTSSPSHCMNPSLFSNDTCSCSCDTSSSNVDKIDCKTIIGPETTWDPHTCSCRHKDELQLSINQRDSTDIHHHEIALDSQCAQCFDCMTEVHQIEAAAAAAGIMGSEKSSWTTMTVLSLLIAIFASTTIHFWRKSRQLLRLNKKKHFHGDEVNINDILDVHSDHKITYDHNGDGCNGVIFDNGDMNDDFNDVIITARQNGRTIATISDEVKQSKT